MLPPRPPEPGREPHTLNDPGATLPPQTPADYAPTLGPEAIAPDGTPFTPGRMFGDYELTTFLARGGMGLVYRARQVSLNRVVALKMISRGQLASAGDLARFKAEAAAAATLDHPHILPIYEVAERDGLHYFSMKLIEGGTLADRIADLRKHPRDRERLRSSIQLFVEVCRAVHFAHQRGVLHRDLKPANVLIDTDRHPYVTDFGLAKRVEGDSGLTQSGAILGTPSYMAPEQARADKNLSTAADVYALGAMLYEMVTGRPPFTGDTPLDTLLRVMHEEPARPRSLDRAADRDLETIALKCLEKEPAKRYPSAFALADDLDRWLRDEPIQARPSTAFERAVKWSKRRPAQAALVLVSLAATVLLVAGLTTAILVISGKAKETAEALQRESASLDRESEARGKLAALLAAEKQTTYFQRVMAAQFALQGNDVGQAERFLESCADDLRNWEWHYLKRQCHGELANLPRVPGTVDRLPVAFSPDGRRYAVVDKAAKVIRFGDAGTGQTDESIPADPPPSFPPAFSPDGRILAVAHADAVRLWDVTTRRVTTTFHDPPPDLQHLGFSSDGRQLAACGSTRPTLVYPNPQVYDERRMVPVQRTMRGAVRVWDSNDGRVVHRFDDVGRSVAEVAFDEDGKRLLAIVETPEGWVASHRIPSMRDYGRFVRKYQRSHSAVIAWDLTATPANRVYEVPFQPGPGGQRNQVVFSPNRRRFAAVSMGGLRLRLHDSATGEVLSSDAGTYTGMAFHPNGRELAAVVRLLGRDAVDPAGGDASKVIIYDVPDAPGGAILRSFPANTTVHDVIYHPGGKHLALAGDDSTIRVLDSVNGLTVQTLRGHESGTAFVGFSPDGRRLASVGEDRAVKLWDATGLAPARRPGPEVEWVVAGPEPREFSGVRGVQPFNRELTVIREDGRTRNIDHPSLPAGRGVVGRFATGGHTLVLGVPRQGGTIRAVEGPYRVEVWDLASRRVIRTLVGNPAIKDIAAVAVSRDGRRVAAAIGNRNQQTLSANTADGRIRAAPISQAARVVVWDRESGHELYRIQGQQWTDLLDFLPDDSLVIAGYIPTAALAVHDAATGAEVRRIALPQNLNGHLEISPDGKLAAVAVQSNPGVLQSSVLLYDLRTGELKETLHDAGRACAFTPDGKRLATGRPNSDTIQLWDTATGELVLVLPGQGRIEVRQLAFSLDGTLLVGRFDMGVRVFNAIPGTLAASQPPAQAGQPDPINGGTLPKGAPEKGRGKKGK